VTEWFVAGTPVADGEAQLARCGADLLDDDPRAQVLAARQLESFGRKAVPALRRALREGNRGQQLLAIRTLKHLGPQAADASGDLAALSRGEPSQRQRGAVVALAEVEPERAAELIDPLLGRAANPSHPGRHLIVESLAQVGTAGLKHLIAQIDSPEPGIRLAAFDAFARAHVIHLLSVPGRCDPHFNADLLRATLHRAANHGDPKIRARVDLYWQLSTYASHGASIWPSGGMF
jgi:HEAT repeat protein